jgi:hypothetical protein
VDRCRSGAYVTTTDSPASSAAATATPSGISVMSLSFCPLPGSTHSAHAQLSRSHTAGKRSERSPTLSSSTGSPSAKRASALKLAIQVCK